MSHYNMMPSQMYYHPQVVPMYSAMSPSGGGLPKPAWLMGYPEHRLLISQVSNLIRRFGGVCEEMKEDLQHQHPLSLDDLEEVIRWLTMDLQERQGQAQPPYASPVFPSMTPSLPQMTAPMPQPIQMVERSSQPSPEDGDDSQPLRKGKWTAEEEEYTHQLVKYFNDGLLQIPDGTTLRAFLSSRLKCDRMRITKKFRGICFGRKYKTCDATPENLQRLQEAEDELKQLESKFMMKSESERSSKGPADALARQPTSQPAKQGETSRHIANVLSSVSSEDLTPDQAAKMASMLEQPSEALLVILGQKYLGKLKTEARHLHTERRDATARIGTAVDLTLPRDPSAIVDTSILSSDVILPQQAGEEQRKASPSSASSSSPPSSVGSKRSGVETIGMDSDIAGASIADGKRLRVMTCDDEDADAGKLLMSFFRTVNEAAHEPGSARPTPQSDEVLSKEVKEALERANAQPGNGRKVLVADDSLTTRKFLKRRLEDNGYTVETAKDGQEALEYMKRQSYDVVFLDLEMPTMNGFTCSKAFREWEKTQDSRTHQAICVVSTHSGEAEKEKCAEVGADFFEAKPAKIPGLMRIAELCIKLQNKS